MKILIIEDDLEISELVATKLKEAGYLIETIDNGEEAVQLALDRSLGYDLMIIDQLLPIIDGLTILKALRAKQIQVPIIFLTALADTESKVTALEAGADDYLAKPFAMKELISRIRALSRRSQTISENDLLVFGDLKLNLLNRELRRQEENLVLTKKECALLEALIRHFKTPLSRERMINMVWGCDTDIESGNVDNYIYFLRRRLLKLDSQVSIKTIHGSGYQLVKD